jgi:hypothetical protein
MDYEVAHDPTDIFQAIGCIPTRFAENRLRSGVILALTRAIRLMARDCLTSEQTGPSVKAMGLRR